MEIGFSPFNNRPRRGMNVLRTLPWFAGWLVCVAAPATASDMYVTHSKRGMPIYTDVPPTDGARPIFSRPIPAVMPSAAPFAIPRRPFGVAQTDLRNLTALVRDAARRHGLDAALLMGVIDVESRFRSDALSPVGAMGLMQLMPQTARRFGVADPWEPRANIEGGSRYLRYLLDLFKGDVRLALAGYNAGEHSVIRAGRRIPPFKETINYVPAVLDRMHHWTRTLQRERGAS